MTAYGTIAELSVRIDINTVLTAAKTTAYNAILDAMSRKIDNFCGRPDGFVASAVDAVRYFEGNGLPYLNIPECVSITTVAVKESHTDTDYTTWDTPTTAYAGDGDWLPAAGTYQWPIFNKTPYNLIIVDPKGDEAYFTKGFKTPTVAVTAKYGYATAVPDDIREVCLAEATVFIKRFESSMDSDVGNSDLGTIALKIRQSSLSRDVRELLVGGRWVVPLYGGFEG